MSKVKIGETYTYLINKKGKLNKIKRIESESRLQDIIKSNTKTIFGKRICWIAEKGMYGDMFGFSEDKRLVIVEIKGPKSRGFKSTGYGLVQIKKRFKRIERVTGKKSALVNICQKYGIDNPKERFKQELGINLKRARIDYKPEFYFISTQFKKTIIKSSEITSKKRWVGRWRPRVQCIMLNVLKLKNKNIIVINRYA